MKISELRSGQGNVEVEGVISELGDTRAFNKYGRELKVANAILKDDSGAIKLSLWNDDVMRFKEGDRIKIVNGYVSEFQGEKQLTSGKFGRMEKVIGGEGNDEKVEEIKEKVDEVKVDDKITETIKKGKSKKALVAKKDIKEDDDVFEEKLDDMPEEENLKEEVKEDY